MAAEAGDLKAAEDAIDAGANIDGSNELLYRPLMMAAVKGNISMAKLLIEKGANVSAKCERTDPLAVEEGVMGCQAAHFAVYNNEAGVLRFLLETGADPNATDAGSHQLTLLDTACAGEDSTKTVTMVRELLKAGADPTRANSIGCIALHSAAKRGFVKVIDLLLKHSPKSVNCYGNDNTFTPLCAAALEGHDGAVRRLLGAGARNKEITEMDDLTLGFMPSEIYPIVQAAYHGRLNTVRILLEAGLHVIGGVRVIPRAVCSAVRRGHTKVLRLLLSFGGHKMKTEWANSYSKQAPMLMYAVSYGTLAVINILLEAGADEKALLAAQAMHPAAQFSSLGGILGPEAVQRSPMEEVAIRRMLARTPAFRARSWVWPTKNLCAARGGGGGGGGGEGGCKEAAVPPSRAPGAFPRVCVFRPKNKRVFVNVFAR